MGQIKQMSVALLGYIREEVDTSRTNTETNDIG